MTFYQFVHGELHKRAVKFTEKNKYWEYWFERNDGWRYKVQFPKREARQFDELYGYAIHILARLMWKDDTDYGLALLAQAYDKEEAEYHAPFENPKPR